MLITLSVILGGLLLYKYSQDQKNKEKNLTESGITETNVKLPKDIIIPYDEITFGSGLTPPPEPENTTLMVEPEGYKMPQETPYISESLGGDTTLPLLEIDLPMTILPDVPTQAQEQPPDDVAPTLTKSELIGSRRYMSKDNYTLEYGIEGGFNLYYWGEGQTSGLIDTGTGIVNTQETSDSWFKGIIIVIWTPLSTTQKTIYEEGTPIIEGMPDILPPPPPPPESTTDNPPEIITPIEEIINIVDELDLSTINNETECILSGGYWTKMGCVATELKSVL